VISGFNTDIEFQGTVYHVQTEDKGLPARMITSLVYDRGTILASKRVSYEDLAAVNFDEKALTERLSRQHKLICAAVKAGRIAELKEMTTKTAVAGARAKPGTVAAVVETAVAQPPIAVSPAAKTISKVEPIMPSAPLKIALIEPEHVIELPMDMLEDELVIDAVQIIEDEVLPAEAVAVISELSGQERKSNSKLCLELLGDVKFKGGDRRTVNIMICRGTERKVVPEAQIMVKVLGSTFRPVIFHAKSDANGIARVHLQLPHFQTGRAALLVRAITDGEEIELRRAVIAG
jgi:hypothetical protein